MDILKNEVLEKPVLKREIENEADTKSDQHYLSNFSLPSFKCGEVFVSNSASGQFELKCILCSRQFQKIKQFAKHILKDHLNSDLEHSIDDLVKENECTTLNNNNNVNNDNQTEEELTCEINLSAFLATNVFIDENYDEANIFNERNKERDDTNDDEETNESINDNISEGDKQSKYESSSSDDSLINEIVPTSTISVAMKSKGIKKKFQCKYCKAKYMMKCNLTRHINRKHIAQVQRDLQNESPTSVSLKSIEKVNCNVCGKETTKYKLMQHLRSHDDTRYTHKCETCGKLFISERSLDLHKRNLHLKERPYACKFDKCDRAFVTEHGLFAHQKIHTNDRPFMCPICHKGFFRKTKLDYHFETHHVNRQVFTCDECEKQFMNTKTLERHKICCHFDDKPNCNKLTTSTIENDNENLKNYEDQPSITNKRGNYECSFCPLKFIYKANLTEHNIRKHSSMIDQTKLLAEKAETDKRNASKPPSIAICDICGKETLKTRMRQHLRSHDNSRYTHKCDTCGKLFISEKSMNIHIRNLHLKDRPYPCKYEHCNKKFATENALTAHYQIHTCERQFKCKICEKGFFTQAKLDYHIKTYHINGRIYKCDECDKRFYENGSLQAHKICHSNEKPFECDECPAKFPRERSLQIHKQSHSGVKEYFCKICNKDYSLYNGIYTHMKTHGISYSAAMEKGLAGQRNSS